MLNYAEKFLKTSPVSQPKILSLAAEASWVTGKWQVLEDKTHTTDSNAQEFDVAIGRALLALRKQDQKEFVSIISTLRDAAIRTLSPSTTSSIQTCHEPLLRLHILYEIEAISGMSSIHKKDRAVILESLNRRLDVLGSYLPDKQYLLGIRRAAMEASRLASLSARFSVAYFGCRLDFRKLDIASAWLTSARLARKANFISAAFNAVLRAGQLGDDSAKIEHSRLLWIDGHHRKAIQTLQGAISLDAFHAHDFSTVQEDPSLTTEKQLQQNALSARV